MQNTFDVLQFQLIKDKVASYARGEISKRDLLELKQLSKDELTKEIPYLDEAINLHSRFGNLPIDSSFDLTHAVALAAKGSNLSVEQLEAVAHDCLTAEAIRHYFSQVTDLSLLIDYSIQLPNLIDLEKEIHKIIAPNLTIFDNASSLLFSIRTSITRLEKEMVRTLGYVVQENKDYLSDEVLTMRDGHYVIPVANAHKHKVKGLVLDVSSSGNTTFIEPEILINLSNKMRDLKLQEDEEIRRLLHILSLKVGDKQEEVIRQNKLINRFDFLQAKAMYCEEIKGHVASLSKDKVISINNARHPLLDQEKVVSNSFFLNEDKRMLIISGPNAGGKTVALKTLGICILMFEAGLPIPASLGAEIHYVDNIYLDIGDSQSLQDNLSTFSAHMSNLASIYNLTTSKDLLLLDEVGTGTSPKEGEAIAYGFIKNLLKKHCFALISSHFEGLKAFALSSEGVNNACMLFDDVNLLPTYKLKIGLPGESYGLDVASRFGVDKDVILDARSYALEHEDISISKAIENLTALTMKQEKLIEESKKQKDKLDSKQIELEKAEATLKEKQNNYLSDIKQIKREMIEEASEKINKIVSSVNGSNTKFNDVVKAKTDLKNLIDVEDDIKFNEHIVVGDYVEMPSYELDGKVTRINGDNVTFVTKEGQSVNTKKDQLRKTLEPKEEKPRATISHLDTSIGKGVPLELNIIGFRADEAKREIEKYLDDCRVKQYKRVKIIHGFGSGVLRKITQEYLKAHCEFVDSYSFGSANDGGMGATVVNLK